MSLNVISNFAANVAHRSLVASDMATTNSLTKLASGKRVVSARDDAASLAIGSRLNAEVVAMRTAKVNAGQAGSMLQIADGAMATISDILVRMKELAVQASSGQFSDTERTILNNEYNALLLEIDRISNDTEFNGTTLIKGADLNETTSSSTLQNFGVQDILFDTGTFSSDDNVYRFEFTASTNTITMVLISSETAGVPVTTSINLSAQQVTDIAALTGTETLDIAVGTTGITVRVDRNFDTSVNILETATDNAVAANIEINVFSATLAFENADDSFKVAATVLLAALTGLDANGAGYDSETGILRIALASEGTINTVEFLGLAGVDFGTGLGTTSAAIVADGTITVKIGTSTIGTITLGSTITVDATALTGGFLEINIGQAIVQNDFTTGGTGTSLSFKVGTGNQSYDSLTFTLDNASATALAVNGTDVTSVSTAESASTKVSAAIDTLNGSRSKVGAAQNRLTFAAQNLASAIENAEAARSTLLDLDVAAEMTAFTSKQVLLQTGIAMLAQANQLPQSLLRLFQ